MAASEAARERILGRIQAALREPTSRPEPATESYGEVYQIAGPLLARFETECALNLTELRITNHADDTARVVAEMVASLPPGPIFAQDAAQMRAQAGHWQREVAWSSAGGSPENSQAAVTHCEALVAQTGSILMSSSCGGRGAAVVTPCHIVVAREAQLVADLESAMRAAAEHALPQANSYLSLISGSSRTADIEKILVQGAHGPRKVVVVLERS